MTEIGSPSEAEVNLASRRQAGYFERTIRKKLVGLSYPEERGQVKRVLSEGLEYYYQRDPQRETDLSFFTVQATMSNLQFEFTREGDSLMRRVMRVNPKTIVDVISTRPLTYDEAQALLVVMRRPKAFTAENPPGIINLSPEETELVAGAGSE